MTHDPLCPLSQPCDDEIPEHGYCSTQHGKFCIHCYQWCTCEALKKAEQRMLAKCIAALEERWSESWCGSRYASCTDPDHACRYRRLDVAALRDLQEKP